MTSNGYHPPADEVSDYLRYLPAIYRQDFFIGRFLRIFEDVMTPVQANVNKLAQQFDPAVASGPMVDLLGDWLGVEAPGVLQDQQRRRFIKSLMLLHRLRGTKQGIRLAVQIVTGRRPFITEFSPGLVLGEDASLGLNTSLETGRPLQFHVTFDCAEAEIDSSLVHDIIRRYKPAHVGYTVAFRRETDIEA